MNHSCVRILSWSLVIVAVLCGRTHDVSAHAGPRASDPVAGATLGDTPATVRLSFSEQPEASLSEIRVLDTGGAAYQIGRPESVRGDLLSLAVAVRPLEQGVYIVSWRIVSAVDGHATAGAYAFGVRADPTGAAAAATIANPRLSGFEVLARWVLLAGLLALLGAASAGVAGFGGARELTLGAGGCLLAIIGVALLALAQWRAAAAPIVDLLNTSVGRALLWRGVALGAAGAALVSARWGSRSTKVRRGALGVTACAALAAIAVHVAAGHAAAGGSWLATAVVAQWAHVAAAGIWLGGLAALLIGVRGAPTGEKTAAVRRFSTLAALALLVVSATGALRTIEELTSWRDLISTPYGLAVFVKIALLVVIAALGAVNRWRHVAVAETTLRPLRRAGSGELALAAGALMAAAVLGTLPPPAAALAVPPGLDVSGADFGTTVRVQLTTTSVQPGPNRLVVKVVDYDSKRPVVARRVSLRFTPLDDRGVSSTTLTLAPAGEGSYAGSGANLAFDGRWRVTVLIERTGDSVEVPLDVEVPSPTPFVSIERTPGEAPMYTVQVRDVGHIRFSPDPERAGPSKVYVTCFNVIYEDPFIDEIVVTAAAGGGPMREVPMRRLGRSRFVADVELHPGLNKLTAVGRSTDGTRLRATVELTVPR